jgi:hypothetical protein
MDKPGTAPAQNRWPIQVTLWVTAPSVEAAVKEADQIMSEGVDLTGATYTLTQDDE